ncbi:MAG: hypothetical protein EOO38_16290 [Cytophagaceae bacterium]|nr:MAG: hypothetical protein EOO38_16290 [Cytophagaceae bacterium]
MTNVSSERPIGQMAELLVRDALSELPAGFSVSSNSSSMEYSIDFGRAFSYEPDLEISDSQGRKLYVEIKSERGMSLPNMVRFAEIDKRMRAHPDTAFMVLVWGASAQASRITERPEFKRLNVRHASTSTDARRVVLKAFSSAFNRD